MGNRWPKLLFWAFGTISKLDLELEDWGILIDDLMERRLGDGKNTHFWKDKWCDGLVFKEGHKFLF